MPRTCNGFDSTNNQQPNGQVTREAWPGDACFAPNEPPLFVGLFLGWFDSGMGLSVRYEYTHNFCPVPPGSAPPSSRSAAPLVAGSGGRRPSPTIDTLVAVGLATQMMVDAACQPCDGIYGYTVVVNDG